MIPRLAQVSAAHDAALQFIDAARVTGFRGEFESAYAQRIAAATDNSIYQILPQAVAYPRDTDDVVILARLADEPRFHQICLAPRGGGTGTNGQSLTDGIVVDLSRHMNRILAIDVERRTARVQAGVVKDQLEAAIRPHGLFFAPELSTSNRATIGGMVSTDASGQGSCLYGKTRDHVLALSSVFLGGTVWESRPTDENELAQLCARADRVGAVARTAVAEIDANAALIKERFPKLNRSLTGYDLAHARTKDGRFDLNALLCGAEGTLAFVVEATVNLMPEPAHKGLVSISYASFDQALRSAQDLMAAQPASIETIDSTVIALARKDVVWDSVRDLLPPDPQGLLRGVNLVEFIADDEATLEIKLQAFTARLAADAPAGKHLGHCVVRGDADVERIWTMRKRAVGLLGNASGPRRPVPFVEDTAVPPENLADYIAEFRAVLDREGLTYGMFGHVDAGVLHVRPALDMKDPGDEVRVRRITDEVVALTKKYGGLLWGEHGKGVRSEYVPEFFGPLYPCLQRIKAAADPRNQLNPGKICAPPGEESRLARIDGVPTRGQRDRVIPEPIRAQFAPALTCNGNGACFNFDPNDAMCPSWKATRDRLHSPKGRAGLMREWLRLLQDAKADPAKSTTGSLLARAANSLRQRRGEYDFSHDVQAAMAGCLSCKSCATQCPIRVDVAELRSQFLELYHGRYLRPARHHMVASLESVLPLAAKMPRLYNAAAGSRLGRAATRRLIGLVDSPTLSGVDIDRELQARGVTWAGPGATAVTDNTVVIVQDAFTSYFDTRVLLATIDLLQRLGFAPLVAPFKANGKALHVHGFRKRFQQAAAANAAYLRALANAGAPLVGIDPAVTLTYRQEYPAELGADAVPKVALLQEWLATQVERLRPYAAPAGEVFELLAHCTERTSAGATLALWQQIFSALGQSLTLRALGCCGMAGTYGHEREHEETSRQIYALSWSEVVNDPTRKTCLLATGYSCRSQVKRIDETVVEHPVEALLRLLAGGARPSSAM